MAAHVGPQGVTTGMRNAFARAVRPLARVLLLAGADVIIVQVIDQLVHVSQVAGLASFPFADSDLLLAEALFLLQPAAAAATVAMVRRGWHAAVRVLGNIDVGVGVRLRCFGSRATEVCESRRGAGAGALALRRARAIVVGVVVRVDAQGAVLGLDLLLELVGGQL